MKKYTAHIRIIKYDFIDIDAESPHEAKEKANDYIENNIVIPDTECDLLYVIDEETGEDTWFNY